MGLKKDLKRDVDSILSQQWNIRAGQVIPQSEDITLAGGAVKLYATFLYADLANSTELAMNYDKRVTAKVIKGFLSSCTKLIRARGGEIRSFDGDRVMGIFIGNGKNSAAAKCALQINYAFLNIIKPKLEDKYDSLENGIYELAHCVGVDTSEVLTIRAGIRDNNDLVWIGRAPNIAAKLSTIRNSPYHSYITKDVYDVMNDEAKYSNGDKKLMWEAVTRKGFSGVGTLYRSSWKWKP